MDNHVCGSINAVPVRVLGVQIQDSTCLRDNVNETIVCAVEGYPYPGITFEKDNNPLMPVAGRVTVNDCMMVLLTPVVISDEGLYSCTAKNVANGATIISNSDPTMLQYCSEYYNRAWLNTIVWYNI